MSTMEQALRDEIAEHKRCIASYERDKTYIQSSAIRWHRARLAALTAALPAPGVEAPGDWVMVPRVATDAMCSTYVSVMGVGSDGTTQAEKVMNARRAIWAAMLAAAPSAPAEISQAQAQTMREALQEIMDTGFNVAETPSRIRAREILAALPPEPPR